MNKHIRQQMRRAFTLIELLTVIAIIAILTAIIFPVFATVRENARQSSSLSNLHAISSALGQFQLDNHKNPDVLFAYAYQMYNSATMANTGAVVAMDKAYAQAQSDAQNYGADTSNAFPGLYPEYVHDLASFRDPNNPGNGSQVATTGGITVNVLCPSSAVTCTSADDGKLVAKTDAKFYAADAYDASPQVTGTNKLSAATYVPRYQSSWTDINNALNDPCTTPGGVATCSGNTATSVNYYTHQMRWKNPPADTYVTSTTYHVPNADTVLVLWEGGNVRKLSTKQFTALGADPTNISVSGGVSQADFWKLTPAL